MISYFKQYRNFFAEQVEKGSPGSSLDTFVFSSDANSNSGNTNVRIISSSSMESIIKGFSSKDQPQMINRLFSGVLHPFLGNINVGLATEFDMQGMLVEGTHIDL